MGPSIKYVHSVWGGGVSHQKRTPYAIFPIQKAYRTEGVQKVPILSVRTLWMAPILSDDRLTLNENEVYLKYTTKP